MTPANHNPLNTTAIDSSLITFSSQQKYSYFLQLFNMCHSVSQPEPTPIYLSFQLDMKWNFRKDFSEKSAENWLRICLEFADLKKRKQRLCHKPLSTHSAGFWLVEYCISPILGLMMCKIKSPIPIGQLLNWLLLLDNNIYRQTRMLYKSLSLLCEKMCRRTR